ncbi:RICIN domain-containing protein [Streptomyces sp. SBT349]|uniref:RICIN domain-containing protein n=1 Tax=Streptomyces sp. SBT349 TaxID=1580539 RepID=UPI00131CBBE7|nr:RICIN domain-containing protein [Streptomyces sp. SBT349]
MRRRALSPLAASVSAAALACAALVPTSAQAGEPASTEQMPVLIGDLTLSTFATAVGPDAGADDPYVRMRPITGAPTQGWDVVIRPDGATALVNAATRGCLGVSPLAPGPWVRQAPCDGGAWESWDIRIGETSTVIVNRGSGACLTQPGRNAPPDLDERLLAEPCDGSARQSFGLVV